MRDRGTRDGVRGMVTDVPLFDVPSAEYVTDPTADLSADQRRTLRQRRRLAEGLHPVAARLLHPDAPRVTAPGEKGDGPRCGTCVRLFSAHHNDGRSLKCDLVGITRGAGTDMRRWWPACTAWESA